MDEILEYIREAFNYIKRIFRKVIEGCLNFGRHIVGWFKNLNLKQGRDVPFIANANSAEFKAMLKDAPIKNVGIFQGTYNQYTDEIDHNEYLNADSVDAQTKNVLGSESLVVLN